MHHYNENKDLYDTKAMITSPSSNITFSTYSTNDQYQYSSAKATKCLPKPDFSSIEKKETTLEFMEPGSYKKQKILFPQTPIKSQKKEFKTTPGNFSKELFPFDDIQMNHSSACRKLNFNMSNSSEEDVCVNKEEHKVSNFTLGLYGLTPKFIQCLEEKEDKETTSTYTDKNSNVCFSNCNGMNNPQLSMSNQYYPLNPLAQVSFERSGKFECEYFIAKILSDKRRKKVYKCINKNYKRICIIRKEKLITSGPQSQTQNYIRESIKSPNSSIGRFCTKYEDSWEETSRKPMDSSSPYKNPLNQYQTPIKVLFSYENYYQNGDLLDFLSRLETQNYKWTTHFYWDMIFEMMCGLLYLHQCGFVHFDIQPSNFYINSNGDIILSGLNHIHPLNSIINMFLNQNTNKISIEDLMERDSVYVAPELFKRSTLTDIDFKCDVFSLGLSLLEIIGRINLPEQGPLWREIRTEGFKLNLSFFSNWTEDYAPFASLIQRMICVNVKDRPSVMELLNDKVNFPELNRRYVQLMNNCYKKYNMEELIMNHLKKDNEEESNMMDIDDSGSIGCLQAKRSNSSKMCFS